MFCEAHQARGNVRKRQKSPNLALSGKGIERVTSPAMAGPVLVRDWRQVKAALTAARESGAAPILLTPENAAATYGAGYLAALQERAHREFPDVDFSLIVDCGQTPGYALACLRAGVRRISM